MFGYPTGITIGSAKSHKPGTAGGMVLLKAVMVASAFSSGVNFLVQD